MANLRIWTEQDKSDLREFLNKHEHFMPILKTRKKKLNKNTIESTAMSAAENEGFDEALENIESMADATKVDVTLPQFVDTEQD